MPCAMRAGTLATREEREAPTIAAYELVTVSATNRDRCSLASASSIGEVCCRRDAIAMCRCAA